MNYKAILQYEGTRYRGWQTQGNTENTIQGKLEALLTKMAGEPVEVNGSGRTDAGLFRALAEPVVDEFKAMFRKVQEDFHQFPEEEHGCPCSKMKERRKYPDFSSIEINQPSNHLESIKTDSQRKKQPTPGKESTIFKYHQGTQVKKNTGKEPLLSVFLICCLDHPGTQIPVEKQRYKK